VPWTKETYLRVELVDLAREELVGLLGVGVVDKVVFDLLGLGSHLIVSSAWGYVVDRGSGLKRMIREVEMKN